FFFSSRRRHTRSKRDWSSDVCSSDLNTFMIGYVNLLERRHHMNKRVYFLMTVSFVVGMVELLISGILDLIADDFQISLGQAGLLVSFFYLIFVVVEHIILLYMVNILS